MWCPPCASNGFLSVATKELLTGTRRYVITPSYIYRKTNALNLYLPITKTNLLIQDKLFFVINDGQYHWTLLVCTKT